MEELATAVPPFSFYKIKSRIKTGEGERNMFGHRFSYWFAGILGIYSFLNIYLLDGDRLFAVEIEPIPLFLLVMILTASVWSLNWLIEKNIFKINSSKIHPLIFQFGISVISVIILAFLSSKLTGIILEGPYNFSWQNFLLTAAFTSRVNLFLNCVNGIYFFNDKLKEKALESEKLKTLTTEARLESVNSQLNPHFFFNNLSTISVLIHQDVKLADRYLQKLSEIYRHILKNKSNKLIPVGEEIDFLKKYLELLTIRFEDSLKFSIGISTESLDKLIPPAVLQLLVENVVKHNYFTRKEPLEVSINSDGFSLIILNKKQPKEVVDFSSGIGLQNISDRYRFLNCSIRIENEKSHFLVELPLIDDKTLTFSRRRAVGAGSN